MSKQVKATRTVKKSAPKKDVGVVVDFGDACLDDDAGKKLTLSSPLFATLKRLGDDKYNSWFPTFALETKVGTVVYKICSGTPDDEESEESEGAEFRHPDETLNEESDIPLLVTVSIGDTLHVYDYDGFWDAISATNLGEKGKLSNFKFEDITSGLFITRKKFPTKEDTSKTVVSLHSGKVKSVKKGEETVEKLTSLFELELKSFAEYSDSEALRLLTRVF